MTTTQLFTATRPAPASGAARPAEIAVCPVGRLIPGRGVAADGTVFVATQPAVRHARVIAA